LPGRAHCRAFVFALRIRHIELPLPVPHHAHLIPIECKLTSQNDFARRVHYSSQQAVQSLHWYVFSWYTIYFEDAISRHNNLVLISKHPLLDEIFIHQI
jgi:hypothetical protein